MEFLRGVSCALYYIYTFDPLGFNLNQSADVFLSVEWCILYTFFFVCLFV